MAVRKRTTGMPEHIDPMLCTLIKDPPAGNYIFELKWTVHLDRTVRGWL